MEVTSGAVETVGTELCNICDKLAVERDLGANMTSKMSFMIRTVVDYHASSRVLGFTIVRLFSSRRR